jgi:hypothetical protein
LAAEAAESDPARPLALDQDPEAVYVLHEETWVESDARVREDLVHRAAKRCVARLLQLRRGRMGAEGSPPTLTLTAAWMLRPNQGRSMLGQVLGEMRISAAKKQILQSIAMANRPICPVQTAGSKRGHEGGEADMSTEDDLEVVVKKTPPTKKRRVTKFRQIEMYTTKFRQI